MRAMNSSWRRVLYQLGLVLGSVIFLGQTLSGYWAIKQNIMAVPFPAILVMAWGVAVLAWGIQIISWAYFMRALGVRLTWRQVVEGYTISFLPRYIPGSIWGYLSRGHWLYRTHGVPYTVSNVGSILELSVAVMTNCLVIGACYVWLSKDTLLFIGWVVFATLTLLATWIILHQSFRPFLKFCGNGSSNKKYFIEPLYSWLGILMLFLLWLFYGGVLLLVFSSFDSSWTTGVVETTLWFGTAWLVGFLIVFVPTGLGVRELALSSLITMNLGLLPSQASALSVTCRFITFLAELAWIILGAILGKANVVCHSSSNSSLTRSQSDEFSRKDCLQ